MHYEVITSTTAPSHEGLVLGFFSDQTFAWDAYPQLQSFQTLLTNGMRKLEKAGESLWLSGQDGEAFLLFHCGEKDKSKPTLLRPWLLDITTSLLKQRLRSVIIDLPLLASNTADEQLQQMVLDLDAATYQLLDFKTQDVSPHVLKTVYFYCPQAHKSTLQSAQAIALGVRLARDLANCPANRCTPTDLANTAKKCAQEYPHLQANIIHREQMEEMGMGAFLAVAQGSVQPPQLIEFHYQGHTTMPPIVLVGKGITFDSGGISIKPAAKMEEMKYDMAGAASVLGTIVACAQLKLPIHIIGLMACTENLPSGSAVKPGDIVTSLSGQTIEITNTDAEGRLVLADTLTYAQRFNPRYVIDIATLTGAVIVALGGVSSGLMSNDDKLAEWILRAGEQSRDPAWRLPLNDAYQDLLQSYLADMVNSTEAPIAGSVTAGCFLSRFTKNFRWAHLDVAGTAWISGRKAGATGRPVPLLVQLMQQIAAHAR